MPKPADRFDAQSVRASWDDAADAYAQGQSSGRDYYRYEFFGPAQVALCGDVRGKRLLDVGCGNGYFSREMAHRGARVTGIDLSARMIEHAKRHEADAPLGIEYQVLDAAALANSFPPRSFDMAIAHPCSDTPFRVWERDGSGNKRWLCIDRYFDQGPLQYSWSGWGSDFTTEAIHATLEQWVDWILEAGFELRGLREPRPTEAALRARPDLEDASRVPYYLFFDLACP
jgi:SAM-dependent methyltransferase